MQSTLMLITRRSIILLPVLVLTGLLVISEVIYRAQRAVALNIHRSELVTRASDVRAVLERELYPTIYIAVGLSSYIINRNGQVDERELEGWLSTLFTESRYLRNIAIAPDNRISLVYPLAENRAVLGLSYPEIPSQWPVVQALMAAREPLLQGPIPLVQGGQGLVYRIPVYIENNYWGLVSTVIDADRLFGVLEQYSVNSQLSIKLIPRSSDATAEAFWRSTLPMSTVVADVPLEIEGVAWTLCVSAPAQSGWLDNRYRYLGWALALAMSLVVYLLLHSSLTRRLVQARFNANEERLQAILDGTNIGTWEWNVQTGETRFNERWADIVGYTLEELAPVSIDTWMRLAHPKDLEASGIQLEEHFRGERAFYDIRCRMKHKDGHWVWVHDRGRVMTWTGDGKPLMMFGTHADITDLKQAELELQESEARLRSLFELSPVGIALNDFESGAFLDVNQALIDSSGYQRGEFLRLTNADITPQVHRQVDDDINTALLTHGRYGPVEKEYQHKSGECYPVRLSGVLIDDRQGRKLMWSIIEDISESRRIERLKKEFVSSVSHELRTPLTSISGALGLVRGGVLGDVPAGALDMVAMAHESAQQLTVLINDLLDMDKLVAGKMRLQLKPVPLDALLAKAVRENQLYADAFAVTLHLANPTTGLVVMADEYRLMQILNNLLSNAAKFTKEDTAVTLGVDSADDRARIWVRDHGPGIAADFARHLFKPFSQADGSDARRRGGTGLGLSICKQLAELMHGTIGYDSVPGEGATFYVDLPLVTGSTVSGGESAL